MQKNAVFHKSSENMCYQLNKDELVISIKTGYDIDRVVIEYGDPFTSGIAGDRRKWSGKQEEITEKCELQNHIWWTIKLKPQYKRCKYFFKLFSGEESLYFLESGFLTEEQKNTTKKRQEEFYFPWMNEADINVTPQWAKDTIWYQIFPERFCNGDSTINPENTREWKCEKIEKGKYKYRYGGDLQGIINKLQYLKDLGVTGIYLNPVCESESDHKYDTKDYMNIDKHFGSNQTMKTLCQTAHSMGIKVMVDAVFNHCGRKFPQWIDVIKKGEKSKYKDWFMVNKFPIDESAPNTKEGQFYSFSFCAWMPKLNTNNKEVIDYFCNVCEFWINYYGVDAIRFDVANEVSHKFLKELRNSVKSINKDVYLLGEIWHNSTQWLQGDEYDSVMNYPLTEAISSFWLDKTTSAKQFEHNINRCNKMYQQQVTEVLFNMLDSHDTERLISRALGDKNVFYQQLAILFTMTGSLCIYYGTEIAMDGEGDPDCRRCMPWDEIANGVYNNEIATMKELIQLRKSNIACRSSNIKFEQIYGDRVISYVKTAKDRRSIKVIINADNKEVEVPTGKVLFKRLVENGKIKKGGTLIIEV